MLRDQRHQTLTKALAGRGAMSIAEIAELLGVSEATARRDIDWLAKNARLTRVYGGAMLPDPHEVPFAFAETTDQPEKRRIAAAAAALVSDGDTVILDIGTTALELAKQLAGRPVTIITGNMAIYDALRSESDTELLLLGGVLRRNYQSMVGFITVQTLNQLHANMAFFGASGITKAGKVVETATVEIPVKQAMLGASDRAVLMAAPRKFPGHGLGVVCDVSSISTVITTSEVDREYLDPFTLAGTEIVIV